MKKDNKSIEEKDNFEINTDLDKELDTELKEFEALSNNKTKTENIFENSEEATLGFEGFEGKGFKGFEEFEVNKFRDTSYIMELSNVDTKTKNDMLNIEMELNSSLFNGRATKNIEKHLANITKRYREKVDLLSTLVLLLSTALMVIGIKKGKN